MKLPSPDYDLLVPRDEKGNRAVLTEHVVYMTMVSGYDRSLPDAKLHGSGKLDVFPGYRWDFGSGPAIDTPAMVAASLAHDVFYDMMSRDMFTKKQAKRVKKLADKEFKKILKDYGVGVIRRTYCYWAVRLFGGRQ